MIFSNKFVLSISEVSLFTGLSKSTIKRLVKINDFVEGIKLTPRRVVYRKTDIEKWINSRPKSKPHEIFDKKKVKCPVNINELNQAYMDEVKLLIKRKGI